jgi:hypothetical protein
MLVSVLLFYALLIHYATTRRKRRETSYDPKPMTAKYIVPGPLNDSESLESMLRLSMSSVNRGSSLRVASMPACTSSTIDPLVLFSSTTVPVQRRSLSTAISEESNSSSCSSSSPSDEELGGNDLEYLTTLSWPSDENQSTSSCNP